jgi:hypothetical protein
MTMPGGKTSLLKADEPPFTLPGFDAMLLVAWMRERYGDEVADVVARMPPTSPMTE